MSILGFEGKLFWNTGTSGSPIWNELTICRDVELAMPKTMTGVTARGHGNWTARRGTHITPQIRFEILLVKGDPGYEVIRNDFFNYITRQWATMDGDMTTGAEGLVAYYEVSQFDRGEPLEEAIMFDVTLEPGDAPVAPYWLTVT